MMSPCLVTTLDTIKPASSAGSLDTFASTAPSTNAPLVSSGPLVTLKRVALSDNARPPGKRRLPRPLAEDPLVAPNIPIAWSLPNLASLLKSRRLATAVPRPRPMSMME